MKVSLTRAVTLAMTMAVVMSLFAIPAFASVGPPDEGCFRIENGIDGSFDGITWTFNADDSVTVTGPVASVKVKGGPDPDGILYDTPPFENLTAPINPNTGEPYGISHIDICPGEDPPDPMCLDIPVGYPGTTSAATVNGATATITWDVDGISWVWTGDFDPRNVKIGIQYGERVRETLVLTGASGSYTGPIFAIRVCHCPDSR